jgi:hypothetical protein
MNDVSYPPRGIPPSLPDDSTNHTEPRRALWSAAIVGTIVVAMFGVFYAINAKEQSQVVAHAPAMTDLPHVDKAN